MTISRSPRLRNRFMLWIFILFGIYVVYCTLVYGFQTRLMFPFDLAGPSGQTLPTPHTEIIQTHTDEGRTISWFIPSATASDHEPAPVAVFFHGNAELIDHQSSIIELYQAMGVSVLLMEYRGYGHSEGTPSQDHIVADSLAIIEVLMQRDDVDQDRVVLHGRSIGGGIAAQVALHFKPASLIVESTFKSVTSMAWRYGVPPFLITSPFQTDRAFQQLDLPILIMHGKDDNIVPVSHAHALNKAARRSELVLFDADHNNLPGPLQGDLYRAAIEKCLVDAGVIPAS